MKSDPRMVADPAAFVRADAEDERDEIDALALLATLWRGKWRIVLFALLGLALGAAYVFVLAVPLYTATAVVALQDRESQMIDIESVVTGLTADQATINTQMGLLRSRDLIGDLVRELDLVADPEFNPALEPVSLFSIAGLARAVLGIGPDPMTEDEAFNATVDEVLEALGLANLRESYIIEISMRTESAEKSALMANTLAKIYTADQRQLKSEMTEEAISWVSDRVVALKDDLEAAQTRLENFMASSELVSPEALAALVVQLKDLRRRLQEKRMLIESLTGRLAALKDARDTANPAELAALANDPVLTNLAEKLAGDPGSRTEFDAHVGEIIRRMSAQLERENRQIGLLEKSIADLEQTINKQSGESVKLQQIQRAVEASALIYESFLSRLKELSVQRGIYQPDVRVFSRAVPPEGPSAPAKVPLLALSTILGMFVGSGFVLLRERLQNGFRTTEDLEQFTGVHVIGEIPRAPTDKRAKLLDHIISKPSSAFSEAGRNLRTSILLSDVDRPPKVLMLTSSTEAEGKTTQALSLARNLSLMGKKVLLVEADIRRRTLSEYFDLPSGRPGLVAAVTGETPLSAAVYHSREMGVDILFGEKTTVNAADFFSSKSFADLVKAAESAYDIVVLDTPPVLPVPDARVIGRVADVIVYVVRWDSTPRTQVAAGLRAFRGLKLKITGMVLSQIDPKGMKRYGYTSYDYRASGYYGS